jgi:signal transduction histidine kinase/ActR/RegA family two-component response regulator
MITFNYYRIQNQVEEQIHSLASITIAPASRIAYNLDLELAKELVKGLSQLALIQQATIVEPDGSVMASATSDSTINQYSELINIFFRSSPQYAFKLTAAHDPTENLGELHLIINMDPAGESFINESLVLLGAVLVQSCILAFGLLVLFYFMLTKPLTSITSQLSKISTSDESKKLRINTLNYHTNDEIGLLINTINSQLAKIEQSFHELKIAEHDRKRYTEKLEIAVDSRTKELTEANKELKVANKLLEKAKLEADSSNQSRAMFLANMSHEIRTPISGVLGMINLALDSPTLDEAARDHLELASKSGSTLKQILNDILDIAKVESGRINLENVEFDLIEALEQTTELLRNSPQAKHLDVVLDISKNFPHFWHGDPTRLRQIISNLISNALKFTEKGEVKVEATYSANGFFDQNHPRHNLKLKVSDTGIGMTPEELDVIFTAFTQASSKTTRKFGGTGLGLTLVKQLTECMDGVIAVKSQKGKGSSFTLWFNFPITPEKEVKPLKLVESSPQSEEPSLTEHTSALTTDTDHPERILIVEDNEVNQKVALGLLKKLGYLNTQVAENGKIAVDLIKDQSFDLIMMDCHMPVMDGYDATNAIRKLPNGEDIPIIAVTANILNEDKEKCFNSGMNDFLTKPYKKNELGDRLVHWLKRDNS